MSVIKNLQFKAEEFEYEVPFHITNSVATSSKVITVELLLDNGIVGLGQASRSFRVNGEVFEGLLKYRDEILDKINGLDVRNYRRVFDQIDKFSRTAPSLKAAVQFAVLDGLSQTINLPVYQLLGGRKDFIETDLTIGIDNLETTVIRAKEAFDKGFTTLKLKVGEDLNHDIDRVLAVAEATEGAGYIVDANLGYTAKEAIQFADQMYKNGVNIRIFEQPVDVYDFDGMRLVRNNCHYPVGADETCKTKYDALRLVREDCVDYINIKLMKSGISDALAIVEIAQTANKKLMIGCMGEGGIGMGQSVHFACGTGAFTYHDLDSCFLLKEPQKFRFKADGNKLYPTF
ncbi:MAG: L-Ala-D/L-Glu epimerase [Thermotogaceae bacterium]|jgi:L-alanine-DL-glutamate epimerase-like enolase superfamily enzyme|nr:L-Ala-D/L-Glu epimerase [Thermotogaceae bacterium]